MNDTCICENTPRVWRLTGVTRTLRLRIFNPDGTPLDLSGREAAVTIARDNSEFSYAPGIVVEGEDHNVVKFEWPADKQGAGDYTIEATTVDGSGNVDRVNWHGPTGIRLVDFSFMVRGEDALGVTSEAAIGLNGTYTMNGTGMSAYDEWLAEGHTGTPEEFIAWLRQPATDAAAAAEVQMGQIQERADADHTRAGNDHTRAESDHTRAGNDHTQAGNDHTRAGEDHTQAEGDHTRAGEDHSTATADHGIAADDHTKAGQDHTRAGQDHETASDDHTQAGSDHTRAGNDHTRAGDDHTQAGSDHTRAGEDHTLAAADHVTAGNDHTQAGNDHTRAGEDHTQAGNDHTRAESDHTRAESDHASIADKVSQEELATAIEPLARKDGSYDTMSVGLAKNLEGRTNVTDSFFERTTGGDAEVANGLAQMTEVGGNSVKFNQLVDTNTTSVTLTSGRKYYKRISGDSAIVSGAGSAVSVTGGVDNIIDLTAIFGKDEAIAAALGITTAEITTDAGVAAFEAWLAENVGLRAYYPYNPGSVLNVNMAGIETVGRNLLDPTTGKARILGAYSDVYGNYYGITGTHGAITFTSDMGETSTITPDEDGKFLLEEPGELSVADAGADCCVFLWWDGTQTNYVEHKDEKTYLDVTHIYGKLNGTGDLVRVWPTGMPKIGELKDLLRIEDGAVVARRYVGERAYTSGDESDTSVLTDGSTKTYYVLSTPEVYTDLVYQGSDHFDDGTPVTLPLNYNVDNWGIERVLPIYTSEALATAKPELTCKYSIDAVETLNTHADEIEDLYDKNEELDAKKPNKTGDYPGMAVGSAKVLEGTDSKVEDFVFTAPQCADGIAKLNEVRGKSLVWNQQYEKSDYSSLSEYVSIDNDGVVTVNGTFAEDTKILSLPTYRGTGGKNLILGHKYYCLLGNDNLLVGVAAAKGNNYGFSRDTVASLYIWANAGTYNNVKTKVSFIDLTLMFGAGNEPTTVEEFEAMFPLPYYAYNPGEIISNKTQAVEVTGRNQWDEEWQLGYWDGVVGNTISLVSANQICSKNPFRVLPNTQYFCKCPIAGVNQAAAGYFNVRITDKNGVILQTVSNALNYRFTTVDGAYYMYFGVTALYGNTYKNDICINISDASFNGQYEPHKKNTVTLNLPTLTGKLNGEGESVVVFPDGLKSAGSVYDEIVENKAIKRIGVVDLGELTWAVESNSFYADLAGIKANSSPSAANVQVLTEKGYTLATSNAVAYTTADKTIGVGSTARIFIQDSAYATAADFKTAMSGVLLYYELAEPLVYELDEGIPETFQAYKGGTLKQLPENGSEPTTAPCVMSVTYALDAVGILTGLPQNYVSKESLQAMLTAMQSAGLFASYTMTYNATTGKYEFTFTANS